MTTQRTPGKETISLHPRMQNKLGFEILIKVAAKTSANFLTFLRILRVFIEHFSVKIFVTLPHKLKVQPLFLRGRILTVKTQPVSLESKKLTYQAVY